MGKNFSKQVAVAILLVGLISVALGGFFIQQGFAKANLITEGMVSQNITYGGAGGNIVGVIDNAQEAQSMAGILEEHQLALGSYSSLGKDDPKRAQILSALTMENALNMAVMGYGLTDVVKGSGAFMILVGLTFSAIAIPGLRKKNPASNKE